MLRSLLCASLKQATYVRELYPDAKIAIFYIDVRVPGRLEEFLTRLHRPKVELLKGKFAKVEEEPKTGDLLITAEDVLSGRIIERKFDLVVLATGMIPQTEGLPSGFTFDEFGFVSSTPAAGIVRNRMCTAAG